MYYNFVGYGSLLDHSSLRETIRDKKFKLVIIKGYKRVFDLAEGKGKNKRDVLNAAKSKKNYFNGVLFRVTEKELKNLQLREDEYNLEEVVAYDYKTGRKIGKAIIAIDLFFDIDKKKRLPSKKYFIMCRKAAYSISQEFGKVWDSTTFISDGEKVSQWLKKHKDYDK